MRKISLFMLFLVSSMTLCLTSCLGDDEDDSLTQEQILTARQAMRGNYSGTTHSYVANSTKKDSTFNTSWTLNDSTVTIYNFPVSQLALALDSASHKTEIEAIKKAPAQQVKCYWGFYNTNNFGNPYYYFGVAPATVTVNFEADGKSHQLKASFQSLQSYMSVYSVTQHLMGLQFLTYQIQLDNATISKQMLFVLGPSSKY